MIELTDEQQRQIEIEDIRSGLRYEIEGNTIDELTDQSNLLSEFQSILGSEGGTLDTDDLIRFQQATSRIAPESKTVRGRYEEFLRSTDLVERIRAAIEKSCKAQEAGIPLAKFSMKKNHHANFHQLEDFDKEWVCPECKTGSIAIRLQDFSPTEEILLSCPNRKCGKTSPNLARVPGKNPFRRTAKRTLDTLVRCCIGSKFPDVRQHLVVLDGPSEYKGKKVRPGTVLDIRDKSISRRHIRSALSVLPSSEPIELNTIGGDRVTIGYKSKTETGRYRYFGINAVIISRLATEIVSESGGIVPVSAFKSKEAATNWAQNIAAQILYSIKTHEDIASYVSTRNAGSVGIESEANLYVLSRELTVLLDEEFIIVGGENELKRVFDPEIAPPMIAPPKDWGQTDTGFEGGYLTDKMRAQNDLIADEKYHLEHGHDRFKPSQHALDALNKMQETKWTTDKQMHEFIRQTIDNEVRSRMDASIVIRPSQAEDHNLTRGQRWQITFDALQKELPRHNDTQIAYGVELLLGKRPSEKRGSITALPCDITVPKAINAMKKELPKKERPTIFPTDCSDDIEWLKLAQVLLGKQYDDDHLNDKHRLKKCGKALLNDEKLTLYNTLQRACKIESEVAFDVIEPSTQTLATPDRESVSGWLSTINQSELFHAPNVETSIFSCDGFYHSWYMDWRGRCYTRTNILSPQKGDVSRGLLRFAEHQPLNESGWDHLSLYAASLWRGRGISGDPNTKERTALLTWSQTKAFRDALLAIASDPMDPGNYQLWAHNDVLSSGTEGFQRLAVTLSFCDALNHGKGKDTGVGAPCNHPVVMDASTNIYQHMSMLMRSETMAREVNVLPKDGAKPTEPADVYERVAEEVRDLLRTLIDQGENPFVGLGFDETLDFDEANENSFILRFTSRKQAKGPVMTMGYGSGSPAMIEGMLTHNGDARKKGGRVLWLPFPIEFYSKNWLKKHSLQFTGGGLLKGLLRKFLRPKDPELNWQECAHPQSSLIPLLQGTNVRPEHHLAIAKEIVKLYRRAVQTVLPECKHPEHILKAGVKIRREDDKPLSWTLNDQSVVHNIVFEDGSSQTVEEWVCHRVSLQGKPPSSIVKAIDAMKEQLPSGVDMDAIFPPDGAQNDWVVREKLFNALLDGDFDQKIHLNALGLLNRRAQSNLTDDILVAYNNLISTTSLRFRKYTRGTKPDVEKERRGIAPNFVHSIDAMHMRQSMFELSEHQDVIQLWSVHDAFGAHPNDIEKMREIVLEQFVKAHQVNDDEKGMLHKICTDVGINEANAATHRCKKHLTSLLKGKLHLDDVANNRDGCLIG